MFPAYSFITLELNGEPFELPELPGVAVKVWHDTPPVEKVPGCPLGAKRMWILSQSLTILDRSARTDSSIQAERVFNCGRRRLFPWKDRVTDGHCPMCQIRAALWQLPWAL